MMFCLFNTRKILTRCVQGTATVLLVAGLSGCGTTNEDGSDGAQKNPSPEANQNSKAEITDIERVGNCMKDRGWDVTVDVREGSMEFPNGYHEDQAEAVERDREACFDQFGDDNVPLSEMSDEQWRDEYDTAVAVSECMVEHGHNVAEPPSFEVFKEGVLSGTSDWDPRADPDNPDMSSEEHYSRYEDCPFSKFEG